MQPATHPASSSTPLPGDFPLHRRLALVPAACLAWRAGAARCTRCATACPIQALTVDDDGPKQANPCLGCGRCAAACPTGALNSEGFSAAATLRQGNAALAIECTRVPASALAPGSLRVPCLGGVGLGQALEWADTAGQGPLHFIDRGACGQCPAGGAGAHPAARLVARLQDTLAACGWPDEAQAQLVPCMDKVKLAPLQAPAAKPMNGGRRAFLFRPAKAALAAPETTTASARRSRRTQPVLLPERERILATATRLAARRGLPLPANLLPRLTASASCHLHQVCVAICPSGALKRVDTDTQVGVAFDARRCVACSACVDACPDKALALATRTAGDAWPGGVETLSVTTLRTCTRCLKPFSATEGAEVCGACRRSIAMARDVFGTTLATRRMSV